MMGIRSFLLSYQSEKMSIKYDRARFPHLDQALHKLFFCFGKQHLARKDNRAPNIPGAIEQIQRTKKYSIANAVNELYKNLQ